jgi:cytidylate kinase
VPGALVIAVDGPAGSGKSTVSRAVAERLGLRYLDTGAMYRAATLAALEDGVDLADPGALAALVGQLDLEVSTDPGAPAVRLAGRDVSARIREPDVTGAVSVVAAVPAVRADLVARQRQLAGTGGIVVEGRDVGSVVLPGAPVKVYLTASPERRAERRAAEHGVSAPADVAATAAALAARDLRDSTREHDPLRPADDAVLLNTSDLGVDEAVEHILRLVTSASSGQVSTFPSSPSDAKGSTYRLSPAMFRAIRLLAGTVVRLLFRLRVHGAERIPRTGPVLIAGNHSGFLDGPLVVIFTPRQVAVLAKIELFHGLLGKVLLAARQIPVRRGRPDRAALRASADVLRRGEVLGIFPEGTRGEGTLQEVQHGAAYVLIRSGVTDVPIVPVVCRGTSAALPKGSHRPRWRAPIEVVFGEPFTLTVPQDPRRRHSRHAVAEVAEELRGHLLAHLHAVEQGWR